MTRNITFAGGRWEIAAAPKSGWDALAENQQTCCA
jgi:hypothetical protein